MEGMQVTCMQHLRVKKLQIDTKLSKLCSYKEGEKDGLTSRMVIWPGQVGQQLSDCLVAVGLTVLLLLVSLRITVL